MKKEKFTAIILARGGSKGIKLKNLKRINGKPLIYWTIRDCMRSKQINSVWVSTENKKILEYSKKCGAKIINRPKKYAKDTSTSDSTWLHAIKFLEKKKNTSIVNVVGLQPTSPLRDKNDLDKACHLFLKKKYDSLFSALPIFDHFIWKEKRNKLFANYNFKQRPRRQNIRKKFLENGSFYIFKKNKFILKKNRLFGKIGFYPMSKINSFQIDDNDDIKIIESLKKYF
jgi:CMP-N,N'-diacetyllegionaminic acid synthase